MALADGAARATAAAVVTGRSWRRWLGGRRASIGLPPLGRRRRRAGVAATDDPYPLAPLLSRFPSLRTASGGGATPRARRHGRGAA